MLALALALLGQGAPVLEKNEVAEIDWSGLSILVQGEGAPQGSSRRPLDERRWSAETAATENAQTRMKEALALVRVAPGVLGSERMSSPAVVARIDGLFDLCSTEGVDYEEDGAVRLGLRCPLGLGFASALLPPSKSAEVPPSEASGAGVILVVPEPMEPVLAPVIVGPDGARLFDVTSAGPGARMLRGLAAYARDEASARMMARAGEAPVKVQAQGIDENGAVKVDEAGAAQLQAAAGALSDGRLVIVAGGQAASPP
ncbi:MAG: hypothetical protein AAGD10_04820 [Myxococcota bacterium]